jgi:preprotein translocase subunit SecG
MTAVTIIIDIVLILVSIILIVTVLMQQGQRQGLGAIGGGAETFFGKNKAKSYEGKLAMLTKVCAIIFIVLALVATIVTGNVDKTSVNTIDEVTPSETVAAIATAEATVAAGDVTTEPTAEITTEPTAEASPEATTAD